MAQLNYKSGPSLNNNKIDCKRDNIKQLSHGMKTAENKFQLKEAAKYYGPKGMARGTRGTAKVGLKGSRKTVKAAYFKAAFTSNRSDYDANSEMGGTVLAVSHAARDLRKSPYGRKGADIKRRATNGVKTRAIDHLSEDNIIRRRREFNTSYQNKRGARINRAKDNIRKKTTGRIPDTVKKPFKVISAGLGKITTPVRVVGKVLSAAGKALSFIFLPFILIIAIIGGAIFSASMNEYDNDFDLGYIEISGTYNGKSGDISISGENITSFDVKVSGSKAAFSGTYTHGPGPNSSNVKVIQGAIDMAKASTEIGSGGSVGARNAALWAVAIANDDSFNYGTGNRSHHYGCYFCGTNITGEKKAKKGDKWNKTYCCNPFVHAAFAHGTGNQKCLKACQNGGGGGVAAWTWTRYRCFKELGHCKDVSFSSLVCGDVVMIKYTNGGGHVWLYLGDDKLVEASGGGFNANSITVRNGAKSRYSSYQKSGTRASVVRYIDQPDDKPEAFSGGISIQNIISAKINGESITFTGRIMGTPFELSGTISGGKIHASGWQDGSSLAMNSKTAGSSPKFNAAIFIDKNPYDPEYRGQCTWFAWARFYEMWGYDPGFRGDGWECVSEAVAKHPDKLKFQKGGTPKPGSIFSWTSTNHTGIVVSVDTAAGTMVINDGNRSGTPWNYKWSQTESTDRGWNIETVNIEAFNQAHNTVYAIPKK